MHDLIKDGQILKSHNFGIDTPPTLAEVKGKWVPRTTVNPEYDTATQNKTGPVIVVNLDSTVWTYTVTNKTPAQLQAIADAQAAIEEIENETISSPLHGITFTEAENYIDNNVTDLQSSKVVLRKLAKAILLLNKRLDY